MVEIVALTGTLADAGEYGIPAVAFGDVVDQFHDEDGFADACTTEQADLTAFGVGREEIDHFDAGLEDFIIRRLVHERRRFGVDGGDLFVADRAALIDRLTDYVHDAAEGFHADGNGNCCAGIGDFEAAGDAVRRVHRDGAHGVFTQVLGDFEDQAAAIDVGFQRVQDRGEFALREPHIDHGADDLRYLAAEGGLGFGLFLFCCSHDGLLFP